VRSAISSGLEYELPKKGEIDFAGVRTVLKEYRAVQKYFCGNFSGAID